MAMERKVMRQVKITGTAKSTGGNAKTNKLNPAQSRVAAGKYRDEVKKTGAKTMDQTGAALGKAIRQTQKLSAKPAARSKAGASTVSAVAKRFGVTAREARDIATAIGNVGAVVRDKGNAGALGGTRKQLGAAAKEIKKQVGETAKAAKTGKKGTPSKQYMTITGDQPARLMAPGSGKKRK